MFWPAVEQVLREAGTPLHVKDITAAIEARGLWRSEGRTPIATVAARLASEVKENGNASRFRRASTPNTFELNPNVIEAAHKVDRAQNESAAQKRIPDEPRHGVSGRLSFVDAAEAVLWRFGNRQPMHYRDITKIALSEGLVQTKGKTPEATLYARIIDEIAAAERRNRQPRFARHGRGFVSLAAWHADASRQEPQEHASALTDVGPHRRPSHIRSDRVLIEPAPFVEAMLRAAGWHVSSENDGYAVEPVAVRNFRIGRRILDYALLAKGQMLGFVETKRHPIPLELVERQTSALAEEVKLHMGGPGGAHSGFMYLVNGSEIFFLAKSDDASRREVAGFHRPETLMGWDEAGPFRRQVAEMPPSDIDGLPVHHTEALQAIERSLAAGDRHTLVELPTGAGAISLCTATCYRLLRQTTTQRILVLVASQAHALQVAETFSELQTPDGRFGDRYSVALATRADTPAHANVLVMTIQRLHVLMSTELDPLTSAGAGEEQEGGDPHPGPPLDAFDFIWCTEPRALVATGAERLLDRLDAPVVGTSSVPSREVTAYFDGNVVISIDLATLIERGSVRSAEEWIRKAPSRQYGLTPAPFLLDFLQRYLTNRQAARLVDPAVCHPALLAAIMDAGAARQAVGFVADTELADVARRTYPDKRIDWMQGNMLNADEEEFSLIGASDLIISFPPLGMQSRATTLTTRAGEMVEINDEAGRGLMLRAATRLAPNGEAIFLVTDNFFYRRGSAQARSLLSALGLNVHAVVATEHGIEDLSVPTNLIFVSHTNFGSTFVGQLTPQVNVDHLLSNLLRRRRGAVPELGRFIPWEDFRGYTPLAAAEQAASLIASSDLDTVPLAEILAEPVSSPSRTDRTFVPSENAVYLLRSPNGPVHTRREQLTGKPQNYYQLILDPRYAVAEYVALTLTTPLGRALLAALGHGSITASIPLRALADLRLPLPSVEVQRTVTKAQSQIRGLHLELDGLERKLASNPREAATVAKALQEIGERDPRTTLRDTMPFPLASILWRYEADADVVAKVDHLHRFFEASAIYLATVLLSTFYSRGEMSDEERPPWSKRIAMISFERSSFGMWTSLGALLAGHTRARITGDDHQGEPARAPWALDTPRFIEAVSSEDLWQLLDDAKDERNRSKAHGGILGKSELEDIHMLLGNLLTHFGELVSEPMTEVRLIRPGAAKFRSGVGHYERTELLQGPHAIFQQTHLSALAQMDADELYLVSSSSSTVRHALQLAPFLRLQASPRSTENACYFYSRLTDNAEAEFISHHYEALPRITLQDQKLMEFLARIGAPVKRVTPQHKRPAA